MFLCNAEFWKANRDRLTLLNQQGQATDMPLETGEDKPFSLFNLEDCFVDAELKAVRNNEELLEYFDKLSQEHACIFFHTNPNYCLNG